MKTISASELQKFLDCQTEHKYRYVQLRVPRSDDSRATYFGSMWHDSLKAIYKNREKPENTLEGDDAVKFNALLAAYESLVLPKDLETLKPFQVEEKIYVPSPVKGIAITGYLDMVYTDAQGRIWVMEHKTTSRGIGVGSNYWDERRFSYQSGIYLYALERMGFEPRGVVFNVAKKPMHRRKKNESDKAFATRIMEAISDAPGDYLSREEYIYSQVEKDQLEADIKNILKQKAWVEKNDAHTKNRGHCFQMWGKCRYFDVCSGAESLDSDNFESRKPRFGE